MALALLVSTAGLGRSDESAPPCPEVRLRSVRWQALPDVYRQALVSPEGKLWCTYTRYGFRPGEGEIRAQLRRGFSSKVGVLRGCTIRLFGPGKTVWVSFGHNLLGYDGRRFVRGPDGKCSWQAHCAVNGQASWGRTNAVVDGKAVFLGWKGIRTFARGEWSFRPIPVKPFADGSVSELRLMVEPDGRGFVVFSAKSAEAWRWRPGRWSSVRLGLLDKESVRTIAPAGADGIWVETNRGIRSVAYARKAPLAVAGWIAQLGDEDWRVRERATESLIACGFQISPDLEKARKKTDDPEVKLRLEKILASFRSDPGPLTIGAIRLEKPRIVFYDRLGRVFLAATEIVRGRTKLGKGLVIVHPGQGCEVLLGQQFFECMLQVRYELSRPLLADGRGRRIWTPGDRERRPPKLLDLDRKEFTASFPNFRFGWLHGVMPDGTVLCARGRRNGLIAAYNHRAVENRAFLPADEWELRRGGVWADWPAPDGSVWAIRAENKSRVVRFDGSRWKPVPGLDDVSQVFGLMVGRNGIALIGNEELDDRKRMFRLATPKAVYTAKTLEELIEKHHRVLAGAFSYKIGLRFLTYGFSLVADAAGNIWLGRKCQLKAFDGKQWIDIATQLSSAGRQAKYATLMYALPSGEEVCFSDRYLAIHKGESYIGRIRKGKLTFEVAPPCCKSFDFLRDRSGGLWVEGSYYDKKRRLGVYRSLRLTGRRVQTVPGIQYPVLADPAGNIWLTGAWYLPVNTYMLWREGRIVQTLQIPGSLASRLVFSDRPGSVWIWSKFALQHWTADRDGRGKFAHEKTYTVRNIKGGISRVYYSPLGFLAIPTYTDAAGSSYGKRYLYIVRLPGHRAGTGIEASSAEKAAP